MARKPIIPEKTRGARTGYEGPKSQAWREADGEVRIENGTMGGAPERKVCAG